VTEVSETRGRDEAAVQRAAETSVLGSVLRNRGLMTDLGDVAPEHFVDSNHRAAWRVMLGDRTVDDEFSLQIAVPDLDERQIAGIAAANHQRNTVLRAKNVLFESRARRDLKKVLADSLAALEARSGTAAEIGAQARRRLDDVSASSTVSMAAVDVARMLEKQEEAGYVSTGIRTLDYVLYGGFHYGLLTGIFARYKVGKTALMASVARNLERQGVPTLMISLERRMGDVERFIVARALGIDARDLNLRDNSEHRAGFAEYIESARNLRYVHRPGITVDELRAIIVAEIQSRGIKVVLVDYWQLITNPGSKASQADKQQEAAQMVADLAAELDVAIVMTGQLNQEGQPKGGEGILAAGGMVVKIEREANSQGAFVTTLVSNKGPELAKGSPQEPSLALTLPGPHYADYEDIE
jgi:replicative DNA helicase